MLQCDHGLRRQALVQSLLTDVFQGRLRAGQRLVTQELAHRFGVSHTPVREALIELAGVGIIDLLPNRGAVVRRVTTHEIKEICQVRRALECEATRRACGRIELGKLKALTADTKRLMKASALPTTIDDARTLDSMFHDMIAASCGNVFLGKELSRLKTLFRACRDVAWEREEARNDCHRVAEEAREHLTILDALLRNDARGAARAMSLHIRSGARYWGRTLAPSLNDAGEV